MGHHQTLHPRHILLDREDQGGRAYETQAAGRRIPGKRCTGRASAPCRYLRGNDFVPAERRCGASVLAQSIARHGLLQPIVVQENEENGRYMLVCGARRLAACRLLGMTQIDAVQIPGRKPDAAACFQEDHFTRQTVPFLKEAAGAGAGAGAGRPAGFCPLPFMARTKPPP